MPQTRVPLQEVRGTLFYLPILRNFGRQYANLKVGILNFDCNVVCVNFIYKMPFH